MNIEMQRVFLQVFLDSTTIEEHALRAYNQTKESYRARRTTTQYQTL